MPTPWIDLQTRNYCSMRNAEVFNLSVSAILQYYGEKRNRFYSCRADRAVYLTQYLIQ